MKIVIAPDSFKGSMTALEAAQAIERGAKKVSENVNLFWKLVEALPMTGV